MASNVPVKKSPAASGGRPAGLFTWLAVGLVIVVVATLVVVKVTAGAPKSNGSSTFQAASASTVAQLTGISTSEFNAIGVTSSAAAVSAPIVLKKQPLLTGTSASGATLPKVLYIGAEYCPFCAAERWATIIALSRFGTFSNLGNTASYSGDVYGNTQSFTFAKSTYTSKYLVFSGVEEYSNLPDAANSFYYPLAKPSASEAADFNKYDMPKYVPGMTTQTELAYPFISFGNQYLISGSQFTPGLLANESRTQIASGLASTSSPITQAIIAAANYETAAICKLTGQMPTNVCSSSAVKAAITAGKL